MNRRFAFGFLAAMTLVTLPAHALIDAEGLYGRRWYEIKPKSGSTQNVQGNDMSAAVHLDPIPLVPIAFGAGVSMIDLKKEDFGPTTTEAKILTPTLEVKTWFSLLPIITPFVKVKIPVQGRYTIKQSVSALGFEGAQSSVYTISGYHLNAGVAYSPLPLIKVLFETGLGMEKAKPEEIKVNGIKITENSDDLDLGSKYVALGVSVGL